MKKSWWLVIPLLVMGSVLWKLKNAQKQTMVPEDVIDLQSKNEFSSSPFSLPPANMLASDATMLFDTNSQYASQSDLMSKSNDIEEDIKSVEVPKSLTPQQASHLIQPHTQPPIRNLGHPRHRSTLLRPARRYQHISSRRTLSSKPTLRCERYGMGWRIILRSTQRVVIPNMHRMNAPRTNRRHEVVVTKLPVSIHNGRVTSTFPPHPDRVLAFRLYLNRGRYVENIQGDGPYLLVVPMDYHVNSQPSAIPQTVFIDGFQGWFIESIAHTKILDANQQVIRKWVDNVIQPELLGNVLTEASESAVPWFMEEPKIGGTWTGTRKIVMGLEQGQESLWARQELLFSEGIVPELPRIPTNTGWYFVRFYDENDHLLSSLSFRWAKDLKNVSYRHEDTGTLITFQHRGHLLIHPQNDNPDIVLVQNNPLTHEITYFIPFGPQWDHLAWTIEDIEDRSSVVMLLTLRRIYWTVESEDDTKETHWVHHLISLPKSVMSLSSDWMLRLNTGGEPRKITISGGSNHVTLQSSKEGELIFPFYKCATWFALTDQTLELTVNIPGESGSPFEVIRWFRQGQCLRCQKTFADNDMLREHVQTHQPSFRMVTNYPDYQQYAIQLGVNMDLPRRVYVCPYCNDYVRDNQMIDSMNSEMARHQKQKHANEQAKTSLRLFTLTSVSQIEDFMKQHLPPIVQCEECRRPMLESHWAEHAEEHLNRLILWDE
ncbi:hypothetical protein [Sulfobacillus thermosulfidooxidans]|uniref:hypothetical protein n=1 Tax=Sulfobacillus thermosulfidooxidans TaxID=28034 RepID=UPI00096BB597|nr:hypothetical protein [Sulfobacillus thermosulfidooxidans]OLZ11064.1 hypothetical protein BFX05_08530 [Sulfobacillus thermosulfidooxidans]OLZ13483.1 hypothetical protein BFX06_09960 [Sulfobacillus thermosulfidooxidans]OLZ20748.1 hypothetical protein BFX07_14385 [Sulfobacillus thermosulfidooxidans]